MGLLQQLVELNRSRVTGDSKFWKSLLYYFELRVPPAASAGPPVPYLYPLVLPPESLRMTEPFAVDRSFTVGGGLFVEEVGIVARELTITGTTGWKPRKLPRLVSDFSAVTFPRQRSFTRNTTSAANILQALSGQRHFQFLQDTVFRTYADLKQDPTTAEGTELYFHNVKDDEHWRVIPLGFDLSRDASKPLSYDYSIRLLAVAPAPLREAQWTEDQPVLQTLRDHFRMLRAGSTYVRAAIQDLSAVQGELRLFSGQFVSLLDGAVSVVEAVDDFVDGSATLIQQPFNLVENTIVSGLDALTELTTGQQYTSALGPAANLLNSIRKIMDGLAMIGSYPTSFRNNVQAAVDRFQQRQSLASASQVSSLEAAANSSPPQTSRAFGQLGTALMPGDALRANEDLGLGRAVPAYQSAFEIIIAQGDTLANLAARFLGDARRWKFIAIFNNLQPPFLSEDRLPGTLTIGDRILIPSLAPPQSVQTGQGVFGARVEEAAAAHSLGRDLRVDPDATGQYDLVIDTDRGSTDMVTVEGVPNLKQALRTRIITERGTDSLYTTLGCARLVGLGVSEVDLETAQFQLVDTIQADPRISAVRSLTLTQVQPDSVEADMVAEVRGFTRPERIQVTAV